MATYKLRTEKWWEIHISAWQASSLTMGEYARKNNIAPSTFHDRCSKFRKKAALQLVRIPGQVEIKPVYDTNLSGLYLEISDKARLQISNNFNTETFARILQTINNL